MPTRACMPLIVLLAGCSADPGGPARYRQSGEIIALSGGDAGAANACFSCHGLKGEGDGDLSPRLAGVDAGYLVRQLIHYDEGVRAHPQMRAIGRALSGDEKLAVSRYYAALPAPAATASTAPLYQAQCASCHGAAGEGRPGVPAIAGQSAAYVEAQFAAWASGTRRGDGDGTMTRISRQWPASRQAVVAAHVAALGDVPRRP
jgi:cytochrome c553